MNRFYITPFLLITFCIYLNAQSNIFAVLVGSNKYQPSSGYNLQYTENDVEQFHNFLKKGSMGVVKEENITVLINENATKTNIIQALKKQVSKARENDIILFFFSGHGNKQYFCPYDMNDWIISSFLWHQEIKSIFKASKANTKLIFADACNSGSIKPENKDFIKKNEKSGKGNTIAILSSREDEFSFEEHSIKQGIFTHFLLQGLTGSADRNKDSNITILELFNYIHPSISQFALKNIQKKQHPVVFGKFDKNIVISRLY